MSIYDTSKPTTADTIIGYAAEPIRKGDIVSVRWPYHPSNPIRVVTPAKPTPIAGATGPRPSY